MAARLCRQVPSSQGCSQTCSSSVPHLSAAIIECDAIASKADWHKVAICWGLRAKHLGGLRQCAEH